MKRIYQAVEVAPGDDGHRVLLDGRPLRTPARQALILPTARLAAGVAAEWAGQGEKIRPETMPLTRLAGTAVDRMPAERPAAIAELMDYAGTDLLCYRADAPEDLVRRQAAAWQPLLDWLADHHGVTLVVTGLLLPIAQPQAALDRLAAVVARLGDWPLIGVHAATTALGSLVVGLALQAGRLEPTQALDIGLLDERFEIERWGSDPEIERRHGVLRRDVDAAAGFLRALDPDGGAGG